uniref:Golgi SNAP receptor complex member 1 n=1 Tax=Hucho hucho TaxID=62062 RepID=A0A4W5Q6T1_9TELE
MAGGSSNYWEDLRKQARQLENELDLKLVSFSKLCTSYTTSRDGRRGDSNSDTAPLLNNSTQDRMFETMSVEIEQLLAKLTGVNDKMAEYTSTPGVTSLNAALMHTLQRHRDILQDYTHEFHKTKANFLAIREREDLLGSVRKDIETYKSGSGVNNRRTELFLKEHEHLRNSDRLMDDTIRSFPSHQQPHPATQPAEEARLPNPGRSHWRLHHPPAALRLPLMTDRPVEQSLLCVCNIGIRTLENGL